MINTYPLEDMQITFDQDGLWLDGEIHFGNVGPILDLGHQILDTVPRLEIHLKNLHNSDSSGLALLCAWLRKARKEHRALFFKEIPDFIRNIARVYGLDKVLESAWEN